MKRSPRIDWNDPPRALIQMRTRFACQSWQALHDLLAVNGSNVNPDRLRLWARDEYSPPVKKWLEIQAAIKNLESKGMKDNAQKPERKKA